MLTAEYEAKIKEYDDNIALAKSRGMTQTAWHYEKAKYKLVKSETKKKEFLEALERFSSE